MDNNTSQESIQQVDKDSLLEQERLLINEKHQIGYGHLSTEEFLNLHPEPSLDQSIASNLLNLQEGLQKIQKRKTTLFSEELIIEELNKKHAVVHTSCFHVLTEKPDLVLGGMNFTLESKQSFKDIYENQIVEDISGKLVSKAVFWLRSPERRQYEGIVFQPDLRKADPRYYNIWKGLAVEPIKGTCELYKSHVKNIICNGNEHVFRYIWGWLARLIQEPDKLGAVAIVLLGEQGTGKDTFIRPIGKIFGVHYLPLNSIQQLVGPFNFHLRAAVLIHGNEVSWEGTKKDIGKLKSTITDDLKIIEGKGKDAIILPNFTHLVLSSNEDWPVHLDNDDRRFFIIKVSSKHKEDHSYFQLIYNEFENGGINAILYELLHYDISNFDPRKIPQNIESFEIKLFSLDSCGRYIFQALLIGSFNIGTMQTKAWSLKIASQDIFNDYKSWCSHEGEHLKNSTIFGKALSKFIPSIRKVRATENGERFHVYILPELPIARKEF